MSAIHSVTVTVDDDGTAYAWSFACSGTAADQCHQWCAEGCEEICYGDPILSGADVELIAQAPLAGHRWEPMPPHGESCRIVDWLDASDSEWDSYIGEGEGDGPANRSGVIEEEWDGDGYLWRYAHPAEAVVPEPAVVVCAGQLAIEVTA